MYNDIIINISEFLTNREKICLTTVKKLNPLK